jgi:dihydroorotate dehydrogenase
MYSSIRSLLFKVDPERAHTFTIGLLRLVGAVPPLANLLHRYYHTPHKPVHAFGLDFPNPVGLAAGYDKDGTAWKGAAALGFGHIELGTVTLHRQPGNPTPRVFRLPVHHALINRMGFPSRGAHFVAGQITGSRPNNLILGVNLGKNASTPLEAAVDDYQKLMQIFAPTADYLAINISSPNTVGLRRLQARTELNALLGALIEGRELISAQLDRNIPLLVKLAPDLTIQELDDALDVIQSNNLDGVIAANTTVARPGVENTFSDQVGGLSGAPLHLLSVRMVEHIHRVTAGKLPIIGVGGIMDSDGAKNMLAAGATLIQLYTGLVYGGPGLVKSIISSL